MFVQDPGASAPTVFNFNPTPPIRVIDSDGSVWLVASDVAKALEYRNAGDMARMLDDDEKGTHLVRTLRGAQKVLVLNESGLYHAVIKSRKSEAKAFRKWVTGTVLPAIRKTGRYAPNPTPEPLGAFIAFNGPAANLAGRRYFITFDDAGTSYRAQPVDPTCCVLTPQAFLQAIADPNGLLFGVDDVGLMFDAVAALQRSLRARHAYFSARAGQAQPC